ncbi:MAG: bifunctional DNA-binding transcriptional regulator/O6-methylguanine-DNA methyltransferase Ada [Gemmatimonadota bacterium]|nr:bifunctional DNA-binding transcriptional regulator/O6-methylguanine-DNA methyltransferase Ada [Gemmatimonadota bacterium]
MIMSLDSYTEKAAIGGSLCRDDLTDERARWQAVMARDAGADGRFFYGVRSTGIYCRPSCPARRPRADRVVFFDDPEQAEGAGFRACRRCAPRETSVSVAEASLVTALCRFIERHVDRVVPLVELADQAHMSQHQVARLFKRVVGITPREYAETCRVSRFKAGLRDGDSITSATVDAGFSSSSRIYERTGTQLGMTPRAYGRGGAGTRIRYTVAQSRFGTLLVAATERGVCAVSLGESEATLLAALHAEFHAADLARDDEALHDWVADIAAHMDGGRSLLGVPLDVRATAFQRKVWRALQVIPYGVTRSYTDIAEQIGHPTAARAVARACATNPVSLVIPCHRVVRGDGSLGGYRWGLDRKRALLEHERRDG